MNEVHLINYSKLKENEYMDFLYLLEMLNKTNNEKIKEKCSNYLKRIDFSFIVRCNSRSVKYLIMEQLKDYFNIYDTTLAFTLNMNELVDFLDRNKENINRDIQDISNQMFDNCMQIRTNIFSNAYKMQKTLKLKK